MLYLLDWLQGKLYLKTFCRNKGLHGFYERLLEPKKGSVMEEVNNICAY
jgi:hypothetical protein